MTSTFFSTEFQVLIDIMSEADAILNHAMLSLVKAVLLLLHCDFPCNGGVVSFKGGNGDSPSMFMGIFPLKELSADI